MINSRETIEEVLRLWATGMSASQIARGLGLASRQVVIGIAYRARVNRGEAAVRSRPAMRPKAERVRKPRIGRRAGDKSQQAICAVDLERAAITADPVPLLERRPHQCVWPIWPHEETGAPDFLVCGAERDGEDPYCQGHARLGSTRPGHVWKAGDVRRRKFGPVHAHTAQDHLAADEAAAAPVGEERAA